LSLTITTPKENAMTKPMMKERVEELVTEMSHDQESAIRILANALHRVNEAVIECVEKGLSVELQRVKRHHIEEGYWGDMIIPIIVKKK